MWTRFRIPVVAVLASLCLCGGLIPAISSADGETKKDKKADLKPDVAAIVKQSTSVYAKMKSYRHTAKWNISVKSPEGEKHEDLNFTLAMERPNRFVYKMDSTSQFFAPVAAYSDGTTFINFKAKLAPTPTQEYTKTAAPADYKGINIVDDVEFQPIATYVIALMLQGDALADKDVRAALEKASVKPSVTENGKKWQVVEMLFGPSEAPISLYFGQDDHLIGKAVQKADPQDVNNTKITETIEGIKIDKAIEPATFQYTLPSDAKQVQRFSAPQRPNDARLRTPASRVAVR